MEKNTGVSLDTFLKESKALIGDINVSHVQNDIDYYFNLTPEDLSEMNKEDCVQAQYFVMQFSISITKKINSIKAKLLANKKIFNKEIAKVYADYNQYSGYDNIIASACNEHERIEFMDNEINKLEALIQEYDSLSFKAEKLAQVFRDLSFCK